MNKLISISALVLVLVSVPVFSGSLLRSGYSNTVTEACTEAERRWEEAADYQCKDKGWTAFGHTKEVYDTTSSFTDGKNHYKCDWKAGLECKDDSAEIKAKAEAKAKLEAEIKAKEAEIAKAEAKLAAEIKAEEEMLAKQQAELKAAEEAQARLDAAIKPGDEGWVWTTDEKKATWESEHGNKSALDDFWDKLNNAFDSDEEADAEQTDFEKALEADSSATNDGFDFEKALEADSNDDFSFDSALETGNESEEFDFDSELAGVEDYREEIERQRQEEARRQVDMERQKQAEQSRILNIVNTEQEGEVNINSATGITSNKCETKYTDGIGDSGIYTGQCKNGMPHGQGSYTWAHDGTQYQGEWRDGKMNGQGSYTWANGNQFQGEWRNSQRWSGWWKNSDGTECQILAGRGDCVTFND